MTEAARGITHTSGAAPTIADVEDAMGVLLVADDETIVEVVEKFGLDLGAVARMLAGLHDAFGQPER